MSYIITDFNKDIQEKKQINQKVTQVAFELAKYDDYWINKAYKLKSCSTYLRYAKCSNPEHPSKLIYCFRCKSRDCPLCEWILSIKRTRQIKLTLHEAEKVYQFKYLFFTPTVRNCKAADLKDTVEHLFKSFYRLKKRVRFQKAVKGWFRTLHITRTDEHGPDLEYHPHLHFLLAVSPQYFKGKNYIKHDEWQETWRQCLRVNYHVNVDIRAVKNQCRSDDKESIALDKAASDVGRYTTRAKQLVTGNIEKDTDILQTLHYAKKRKRLFEFGGKLYALYQEVVKENKEFTDELKEKEECKCELCNNVMDMVEFYFNFQENKFNYKGGS